MNKLNRYQKISLAASLIFYIVTSIALGEPIALIALISVWFVWGAIDLPRRSKRIN